MEWLLEHVQVLIVLAVIVAGLLQKFKNARETQVRPTDTDPVDAERTRRVQEEIRRRILERRGLAPAPVEDEPPAFPEAPPMIEEIRPLVVPPPVLAPAEAQTVTDYSMEADRQRDLRIRMEELAVSSQPLFAQGPMTTAVAMRVPASMAQPINALAAALRTRAGLRQALVLREIIDAPLGLRPPESPGQGIWTRM